MKIKVYRIIESVPIVIGTIETDSINNLSIGKTYHGMTKGDEPEAVIIQITSINDESNRVEGIIIHFIDYMVNPPNLDE